MGSKSHQQSPLLFLLGLVMSLFLVALLLLSSPLLLLLSCCDLWWVGGRVHDRSGSASLVPLCLCRCYLRIATNLRQDAALVVHRRGLVCQTPCYAVSGSPRHALPAPCPPKPTKSWCDLGSPGRRWRRFSPPRTILPEAWFPPACWAAHLPQCSPKRVLARFLAGHRVVPDLGTIDGVEKLLPAPPAADAVILMPVPVPVAAAAALLVALLAAVPGTTFAPPALPSLFLCRRGAEGKAPRRATAVPDVPQRHHRVVGLLHQEAVRGLLAAVVSPAAAAGVVWVVVRVWKEGWGCKGGRAKGWG